MSRKTHCLRKHNISKTATNHSQRTSPYQAITSSTRDESKDSLFEETYSETSTLSNQSQNKSKSNNNSCQEYIDSIVEAAKAKTIAEDKKSTLEESSDPFTGEEKEQEKQN